VQFLKHVHRITIISTRHAGIKCDCEGETGYLVDEYDVIAWQKKYHLAKNPEIARKMGQAEEKE